jgi:ATP synthase protein I
MTQHDDTRTHAEPPDDQAADRQPDPAHAQQPEHQQEWQAQFTRDVGQKASRKAWARAHKGRGSIWFGLGTFGMVGWSVAIPTLIGIAVGAWLDKRYAMDFSWRLTLMFVGLVVGCLNAWYWVSKERKCIEAEQQERQQHE